MRGFGDNQAGPRDIGIPGVAVGTGFPIGGDALLIRTEGVDFAGLHFQVVAHFVPSLGLVTDRFKNRDAKPPYLEFNLPRRNGTSMEREREMKLPVGFKFGGAAAGIRGINSIAPSTKKSSPPAFVGSLEKMLP